MTNKMTFILVLWFSILVNPSCGQDIDKAKEIKMKPDSSRNIYSFSDSITKGISEGIEVLKQELSLMGGSKENFFILLNKGDTDTYLTISYCIECPFGDILKSTDRFYVGQDSYLIPIVFDFDFRFSKLLLSKTGTRLTPKIGGYLLRINNKGEIISRGLQQ